MENKFKHIRESLNEIHEAMFNDVASMIKNEMEGMTASMADIENLRSIKREFENIREETKHKFDNVAQLLRWIR
jgi:ferritin-like metal-binding protein YciE